MGLMRRLVRVGTGWESRGDSSEGEVLGGMGCGCWGMLRCAVAGGVRRRRLLGVMAPARAGTAEICELNVLVAREFAAAVGGTVEGDRRAAGADRGDRVAWADRVPPAS